MLSRGLAYTCYNIGLCRPILGAIKKLILVEHNFYPSRLRQKRHKTGATLCIGGTAMSKWIEVQVKNQNVTFTNNGNTLPLWQSVSMGLGSIELRKTQKAGLHIARFSKNGNFTYSIRLKQDGTYRLGPERGHRVIPPSEEKDPFKRILRMLDLPVNSIEWVEDPILRIRTRWYDNQHCPNGRDTTHWEHDGEVIEVNTEMIEQPSGNYFSGGGTIYEAIKNASYAISISGGRHLNGCEWSRPSRVVVWKHCKPETLAEVLAPLVYGRGIDYAFAEALQDSELAKKWIASKFEAPKIIPEDGYLFRYTFKNEWFSTIKEGFVLRSNDHTDITGVPGGRFGAIGRLVATHGYDVIDIPTEVTEYLDALKNQDSARKFFHKHFYARMEKQNQVRIYTLNGKSVNLCNPHPGSPEENIQVSGHGTLASKLMFTYGWDFTKSLVA